MKTLSVLSSLTFMIAGIGAVQTETTRPIRRHHHKSKAVKPVQSLSELLKRSADLTKQFEHQAEILREKSRNVDSSTPSEVDEESEEPQNSFIELSDSKKLPEGAGLRAMEAVAEEIMRFSDKMRHEGNAISSFTKH
jgi:hypothetical protein